MDGEAQKGREATSASVMEMNRERDKLWSGDGGRE